MATPQGNYPQQNYQDGYDQQQQHYDQAGYDGQAGTPGAAPAPPVTGPSGRKKRAYAGQAYEFGAGANAGLAQQQQQQPGAGYGGGFDQRSHAAGAPPNAYPEAQTAPGAGYGQPEVAGVGGYQPPGQTYPSQGGAAGLTQQFGQMGVNDKQQPSAAVPRGTQLNTLYPTDLLNQPFNVAELDYPPPPIVLPPNVSKLPCQWKLLKLTSID